MICIPKISLILPAKSIDACLSGDVRRTTFQLHGIKLYQLRVGFSQKIAASG